MARSNWSNENYHCSTCNALHSIFARYGLPTQVVSDNGPPFSSSEYEEFLHQNGIQRILVSPYHPSSNGLAERFVQTFKCALEASASDPASSLQQRIQNFTLLSEHSTCYHWNFTIQAFLAARAKNKALTHQARPH